MVTFKMKIKLKKIIDGVETLDRLSKVKLPVVASFKISKLVSLLRPDVESFHSKREELIKSLGKETKKDGSYMVLDKNIPKFASEMQKLGELEIDIEFNPIEIAELGDAIIEPELLQDWIFKM